MKGRKMGSEILENGEERSSRWNRAQMVSEAIASATTCIGGTNQHAVCPSEYDYQLLANGFHLG
ncbi:MAG: hypothetical protein EBT92_15925 [Planctomycetes bacterium]|nr:hypothetical protein [Planctomycetota bacterium]NBY01193.1 hypothetical protein [Planctomycetota bacterium]